jgi:formamidopyrimidine-DNA glycosylase
MPELPEVETIKRQLRKTILGKKIASVIINRAQVIKEPAKDKFIKGIVGTSIKNIFRKGKVLIWELSNRKFLVVHLRMTGQLVLRLPLGTSPEREKRVEGLVYPGTGKQARVIFKLSDGKSLDFNDRRMLGELRLVDNWQAMKFFQELGPEIHDLNVGEFGKMLAVRKTKVKPLLMDQTFIAGVGNLYAVEALFKAKIHPLRSAASLSKKEQVALYSTIRNTLDEAIKHKGSSMDQYVTLTGEKGDYAKYHKVYDRKDEPCYICKSPIKRISLGGRGTYFCERCQK